MNIPKRVSERLTQQLAKYQKVLQSAKDRDVNEADTVTIVKDLLGEVFGYDKYAEVTSEFAVRSTFCDLAVRLDGTVKLLIEVKAIGLDLKTNHLRQALDYGANHGIDWVVLTNGCQWSVHRILFERPIGSRKICEMDLMAMSGRKAEDQQQLFMLCKEGVCKSAIEEFDQHKQVVNRFVLGAMLLSDGIVDMLRKEIRRFAPGTKIDEAEIRDILSGEVLKREVIDGDEANAARTMLKRSAAKAARKGRAVEAGQAEALVPAVSGKEEAGTECGDSE